MSSEASKLGQQTPGQRSILEGNAMPGFGQMPSYTPVTRPEPREAQQPAQDFGTVSQPPAAPSRQPQPQPAPQSSSPGVFYSGPAQGYQGPAQAAPQSAPASGQESQPAHPAPGQEHPPQAHPGQTFAGQAAASPSYPPQAAPLPQTTPLPQAVPAQAVPAQTYPGAGSPGQTYADPGVQGSGFSHAETGANPLDANFPAGSFEGTGTQDASFPESIFPASPDQPEEQPLDLEAALQEAAPHDYGASQQFNAQEPSGFAPVGGAAPQQQPAYPGQPGQPGTQLATFEAGYDQPPQIQLGHEARVPQPAPAPHPQPQPAQDFYETDADFMGGAHTAIGGATAVMGETQAAMDEAQVAPEAAAKAQGLASKFSLKNRSVFMVGSALLGAIALGGALAVAYKQSGGGMGSDTPLVQADARPVKEVPAQPGGKEFPHKNKLIYDRLQNGDQPETERLVPRQEELALPAMPGVTAGLPQQVATAGAPTVTDPAAVVSVDSPAADGGPRRVKTLMVRPDGTVVPPAPEAAPAAGAAAASAAPPAQAPAAAPAATPAAAPPPQQAAAAPEQVAAIPQPKPAPTPAAKKAPSSYVVQVGSRKNQTEALATFADMQQKYPSLLGSYRPMVQKADLGSKGIWYRLRIGPIGKKADASKLCSDLKSQGLPDCLVMAN